jgi:hypothetical protein
VHGLEKERMDKLLGMFSEMFTIRKTLDLLKFTMTELKSLIRFKNVTIFFVNPDLIRQFETTKPDQDKVHVDRATLSDGKVFLSMSDSSAI